MQQIKIKAILLGAVFAAGAAACCYLVIMQHYLWALVPAALALLAAVYLYRQLQRLTIAKLIQENVVLTIPAGRFLSSEDIPGYPEKRTISSKDFPGSPEARTMRSEDIAGFPEGSEKKPVIVSIFGILAGDKIYKFNCDGIRLFSMKIDKEFIIFTYGTREKQHRLKLTHGLTREEDLHKITEIFRYNTGTGDLTKGDGA